MARNCSQRPIQLSAEFRLRTSHVCASAARRRRPRPLAPRARHPDGCALAPTRRRTRRRALPRHTRAATPSSHALSRALLGTHCTYGRANVSGWACTVGDPLWHVRACTLERAEARARRIAMLAGSHRKPCSRCCSTRPPPSLMAGQGRGQRTAGGSLEMAGLAPRPPASQLPLRRRDG